jgi:hypothetical protein
MKKLLLKLFTKEELWSYLIGLEGFNSLDSVEAQNVWSEVFSRIPMLSKWMKKRELILLRNIYNASSDSTFIRGQIAENKMYTSFDVPGTPELKNLKPEELKVPNKTNFLNKWGIVKPQVKVEGEKLNNKNNAPS